MQEGGKALILDCRNRLRVVPGVQEMIEGRCEELRHVCSGLVGPLCLDPKVGGLWLRCGGPLDVAFRELNKLRVHWKLWKKEGVQLMVRSDGYALLRVNMVRFPLLCQRVGVVLGDHDWLEYLRSMPHEQKKSDEESYENPRDSDEDSNEEPNIRKEQNEHHNICHGREDGCFLTLVSAEDRIRSDCRAVIAHDRKKKGGPLVPSLTYSVMDVRKAKYASNERWSRSEHTRIEEVIDNRHCIEMIGRLFGHEVYVQYPDECLHGIPKKYNTIWANMGKFAKQRHAHFHFAAFEYFFEMAVEEHLSNDRFEAVVILEEHLAIISHEN